MRRVFGVKVGARFVLFDETGSVRALGGTLAALAEASPRCERRCAPELVCEGWREAARNDDLATAQAGAAWAVLPSAPFLRAPSVWLLGAVLEKLSELRRLQPWRKRRFPLEVSACTAFDAGERVSDWTISAPDATTLVLSTGRVEIAFTCDPWADAEHAVPHVTRTRSGRVRPFRRNDELVELDAVLDVAVQVAEGVEEGLVGASAGHAGDFASASALCLPLWPRRSVST